MGSFNVVGANGAYQFIIDHSKTKHMNIGEWITSPTFQVGPHDWSISYYPQGIMGDEKKYVSFYLGVVGGSKDIAVKYGLVLFDKYGYYSSTSLKEMSYTFTPGHPGRGWPQYIERTKLEEKYVKNGCFVLQVSITLKGESYTEAKHITNPIGFPRKRLQEFRDENKCTDITFDVDGKTFDAHRLILALHSPVFKAEFFGSMAESNMDCITIKEMMPSVFKAMLDFMYNGTLSFNDEEEEMSCTSFHQCLLAAADRYAVEELKVICEHKLIESISLDTVFSLLESAEKHRCSELKKKCCQFVVAKENLILLPFTEGYIKLIQNYPSLLTELKEIAGK